MLVFWCVILVARVAEWMYAARCRFHAAIFARLRGMPEAHGDARADVQTDAASVAPRSLASRAQGARGLLRRQLECIFVQAFAALVAFALPWILQARG